MEAVITFSKIIYSRRVVPLLATGQPSSYAAM
jgi:hypothetical protein